MRKYFECCKPCVAPKRHPGCQDHCPEYLADKADYNKEQAEIRKQKEVESNLNAAEIKRIKRIRGTK